MAGWKLHAFSTLNITVMPSQPMLAVPFVVQIHPVGLTGTLWLRVYGATYDYYHSKRETVRKPILFLFFFLLSGLIVCLRIWVSFCGYLREMVLLCRVNRGSLFGFTLQMTRSRRVIPFGFRSLFSKIYFGNCNRPGPHDESNGQYA